MGIVRKEIRMQSRLASSASILAFGPHVHESALEDARQAGCDQVLSRGEFSNRMAEILSAVHDDHKPVTET